MRKICLLQIIYFILFLGTLAGAETDGKDLLVKDIAGELRRVYREDPELSIGARSCVVGDFTWEGNGVGTAFSGYVGEAVEEALMKVDEFELVTVPEGVPVFGEGAGKLLEKEAARGMGIVSGAYRLYGIYRIEENAVKLELILHSEVFSRRMAELTVSVPMEKLPRGMELYPENREVVEEVEDELGKLYSGESGFDLFVTTNRGEAGVFREGEYLKLYLLASRDCYLKIYHIDINGKVSLIFPNRFEGNNFLPGGEVLEFPGKRSPFQFRIVPPFGTETIKVVAGTRQFSSVEEDFTDLGVATRGLFIEEVEKEVTEVMAEGLVHFTILE